ncbi:uncharacterized protein B0I36DRAFT_320713 [Microdochium trichocladiopsis]|uniref:Uncharacterized protein n=1 Tax=Microdochium trichocladiopsis TaxID=1682393 RepID=A0A9P9BV87_9PEZI|nr:uncharacterized protein B0I36DRAFT_320713 [Microdochium trichocladiopsis]KAH7033072.1 hypothetical protein B0I36DRAFT_320713 [Microdochium trichocladiopsis]
MSVSDPDDLRDSPKLDAVEEAAPGIILPLPESDNVDNNERLEKDPPCAKDDDVHQGQLTGLMGSHTPAPVSFDMGHQVMPPAGCEVAQSGPVPSMSPCEAQQRCDSNSTTAPTSLTRTSLDGARSPVSSPSLRPSLPDEASPTEAPSAAESPFLVGSTDGIYDSYNTKIAGKRQRSGQAAPAAKKRHVRDLTPFSLRPRHQCWDQNLAAILTDVRKWSDGDRLEVLMLFTKIWAGRDIPQTEATRYLSNMSRCAQAEMFITLITELGNRDELSEEEPVLPEWLCVGLRRGFCLSEVLETAHQV